MVITLQLLSCGSLPSFGYGLKQLSNQSSGNLEVPSIHLKKFNFLVQNSLVIRVTTVVPRFLHLEIQPTCLIFVILLFSVVVWGRGVGRCKNSEENSFFKKIYIIKWFAIWSIIYLIFPLQCALNIFVTILIGSFILMECFLFKM